MLCTGCGHDNPAEARFCMSCGQTLCQACSACGAEAPPEARFCMSCGASLQTNAEPAASAPPYAAIAPSRPASFANGRYCVEEVVGEGSRKKVYRAHDSVLDRDVALAVIKTEGLDPTSRLLGLLAETMVRLDDAQKQFEDSLAFCRESGYRPELARSLSDYADMLLDPSTSSESALSLLKGRAAEENRQKASALLDESLAISSELDMRPLMERVLSRKMSLQGIDISSPQTSIDAVVSAVEVERPNLQPHAAPDGTVTVMFTDIEGSTAMTERLGDQKAQDVLRIHNDIIRQQVAAHQGFEVKSQGDGFMMAFSSARRAVESAIAIQKTLSAHNAENPSEPIRVRIGLHTGEAIREADDFFGKSVILAARIASQALGGQILVSSLLKALVESSGEFEFGESRSVELKGLSGSHEIVEVCWQASPAPDSSAAASE